MQAAPGSKLQTSLTCHQSRMQSTVPAGRRHAFERHSISLNQQAKPNGSASRQQPRRFELQTSQFVLNQVVQSLILQCCCARSAGRLSRTHALGTHSNHQARARMTSAHYSQHSGCQEARVKELCRLPMAETVTGYAQVWPSTSAQNTFNSNSAVVCEAQASAVAPAQTMLCAAVNTPTDAV